MIVLFENELLRKFYPLSKLRHTSEFFVGTMRIFEAVREYFNDEVILWGREFLSRVIKERYHLNYNEKLSGNIIIMNSLIKPTHEVLSSIKNIDENEVIVDGNDLVAGKISLSGIEPGEIGRELEKKIISKYNKKETNCLLKNYWDFVKYNSEIIKDQVKFITKLKGFRRKGQLFYSDRTEIQEPVYIETRNGPVIIEEEVKIEPFTTIQGPSFIGKETILFNSIIREGTSILENCRIGGEVSNSIIYSFTNKSHYGYIGDAIVAEWVNIGAGTTFSNLKNTYGEVNVTIQGEKTNTGMQKLGPLVGDMTKLAINTSVYGGKKLGISVFASGKVDSDVDDFVFYDNGNTKRLTLDKVIEVQKRMMSRRQKSLSKSEQELIELIYRGEIN